MKSAIKAYKFTITAFIAALLISLSPIVFGDDEKDTENTQASSDCKVKAYTDPEVFAKTMADPAKFMELMALMSNPQTAQNMMECGMDSTQWNEIMVGMSDPTKMMNAMTQFMNPQMYMNWMAASMNPAFYQSSMNTYMNPALYMQWMTASMNPAFYQPAMNKMTDPQQIMNPNNFTQMFGSFFQAPVVADATVTE